MPEIEPLTGEEIVFIRRLYSIRKRMVLAFWGVIAAAIAGGVIAAVTGG